MRREDRSINPIRSFNTVDLVVSANYALPICSSVHSRTTSQQHRYKYAFCLWRYTATNCIHRARRRSWNSFHACGLFYVAEIHMVRFIFPRIRHPNIASVVGVTKGYDGLNGFVVAMGKRLVSPNSFWSPILSLASEDGAPIKKLFETPLTGSVLARCVSS